VEADFGEIEKELRASAAAQVEGRGVAWEFQRRQGMIVGELIAAPRLSEMPTPETPRRLWSAAPLGPAIASSARSRSASPGTALCRS